MLSISRGVNKLHLAHAAYSRSEICLFFNADVQMPMIFDTAGYAQTEHRDYTETHNGSMFN